MSTSAVLRHRLARRLRDLRLQRRLSQEEAAERIGVTRRTIVRTELGESVLSARDLARLLDLYEVDLETKEELIELGRQARKRGGWWAGVKDLYGSPYLALEQEAAVLRTYQPSYLPGVLQTEEYARATIATLPRVTPEEIDRRVAVRMQRQHRLTSHSPLSVQAVLDETILHRAPGSAAAMHRQLRRLAEVADLPNVDLRVLPFSVGVYPAMGHAFTILVFPTPQDPAVALVEHLMGERYIDDAGEVGTLEGVHQRLWAMAMDAHDSTELIKDLTRRYAP